MLSLLLLHSFRLLVLLFWVLLGVASPTSSVVVSGTVLLLFSLQTSRSRDGRLVSVFRSPPGSTSYLVSLTLRILGSVLEFLILLLILILGSRIDCGISNC